MLSKLSKVCWIVGASQVFCLLLCSGSGKSIEEVDFHNESASSRLELEDVLKTSGRIVRTRSETLWLDARYAGIANPAALLIPRPPKRMGREA